MNQSAVSRLCLESHTVTTDLPDVDEVYALYLETCKRLGVEPVQRGHAQELMSEWSAKLTGRGVASTTH